VVLLQEAQAHFIQTNTDLFLPLTVYLHPYTKMKNATERLVPSNLHDIQA